MANAKIVFLGRTVHEKTKSDRFFLDILKDFGQVHPFRREAWSTKELLDKINQVDPDLVIFYQLPPSFRHHLLGIRCKNLLWAPMWDGFRPLSWKKSLLFRWKKLRILSFSQEVHQKVRGKGLLSYYLPYFPPLSPFSRPPASKGPYTIFFWQRLTQLGIPEILSWLRPEQIGKIILKSELGFPDVSKLPFPVEKIEGWLSMEDLRSKMEEADLYVAPRFEEGIGFSFLEALAAGRPVLAYDGATMNEYIRHGENGFLKTMGEGPVDLSSLDQLGKKALEIGKAFREQWEDQRSVLREFVMGKEYQA